MDLDIPPLNVIQDKDLFTSEAGVKSYMAYMYAWLPIEDFRWSLNWGFNFYWIPFSPAGPTGEALCRDAASSRNEATGFWAEPYRLIRNANYFIKTMPEYASNFPEEKVNNWIGEAYFLRGVTYFALAKRYGGVPLVDEVLNYPEMEIEECQIPRSSEEDVYNHIASDFDKAISLLPETNEYGRANKYAAAAFKSRAMLFAGSIAKYNETILFDVNNHQLCGIPSDKANDYFKLSYESAKLVEGHYSLYMKSWKADDKEAQYENFVDLFFDESSPENIFVKDYHYPELTHSYDVYYVPRQRQGNLGISAGLNPTLEFVEMFDGLPKNEHGKVEVFDENGKYQLYDTTMDFFKNAEPRLRATVIFPGDWFVDQYIEIRRGIYTNPDVKGGISRIIPEGATSKYEQLNPYIVGSPNSKQTPYILHNGKSMYPAGLSGIFYTERKCALTGFSVRKYMQPDLPISGLIERNMDQTWIEIRYAEVLLNRAESAYELYIAGLSDRDYLQDTYECINALRERGGGNLIVSKSDLSLDVVRTERRKELGFENKAWFDLRRWRIFHIEQSNTRYRGLYPFYIEYANKYFFDARLNEQNFVFNWNSLWYYQQIPPAEILKSPILVQNPGY
jgi:hypothetical protein